MSAMTSPGFPGPCIQVSTLNINWGIVENYPKGDMRSSGGPWRCTMPLSDQGTSLILTQLHLQAEAPWYKPLLACLPGAALTRLYSMAHYSKCGPQTSSISIIWELAEMHNLSPIPDPMNQNLRVKFSGLALHLQVWKAWICWSLVICTVFVRVQEANNHDFSYHTYIQQLLSERKSCPGQCGSVGWALSHVQESCWFGSRSGHMPGLQSLGCSKGCAGGSQSMFLSLSLLSSPSKINKNIFFKKEIFLTLFNLVLSKYI